MAIQTTMHTKKAAIINQTHDGKKITRTFMISPDTHENEVEGLARLLLELGVESTTHEIRLIDTKAHKMNQKENQ